MISRKEMIAASITIYDQNNRINDFEMQRLWDKVLTEGADGLFIGGSVGECFLQTTAERIHTFELASSYMQRTQVYAHVGSIATSEAIEMTRAARSFGINRIASTPPFYFGFTTRELAHYFYDLAEAADSPVLYYDIPSSTHMDLDVKDPEIRALLSSGAVGAIKHTNLLSYRMKQIREVNPNIKIMGGFESRMVPMLHYNCDGFIGSTFNFMLPQYRKIIELFSNPNKGNGTLYQTMTDSTDILNTLLACGLPASIKYILSKQGIHAGEVRRPLLPLTEENKRKLDDILEKKLKFV